MVPSEYRLEQVCARLTERLESTRRSYAGNAGGASDAFRRLADGLVDNAIAEYSEDGFLDHPQRHAELLRTEIVETFLPRYTRLATEMTDRERAGYGMGFIYGPIGRIVLFGVALLFGAILLRAPGPLAFKLVSMIPLVLGVFLPDLLAWLAIRRYRGQLVELMQDMERIQERAGDYAPTAPVLAASESEAAEASTRRPEPPLKTS